MPEQQPPARRRTRVAVGVYKDRWGFATTVKVGGVQRELRFPKGTPLKTIRARRDELRAKLRTLPHGDRHTLAHDAARYLEQVNVSLINRQREIGVWLDRFGHLQTLALPTHVTALNAQLRDWRRTLAASTCNHRRDALTNLVKVLYGRRAAAELVDLVRFPAEPPVPRWIERTHIAEVLARLSPATKTSPRLWLMHWTGMRPSQMGRLTRDDLRLDDPIPYIAVPRGKGGTLAPIPLVDDGLAAARAFVAADAFGPWSCPSANNALVVATRRANEARAAAGIPSRLKPFTVYTIRHSFAAALRRTGADVADIQDLYGHMDPEVTRIYAPPTLAKHLASIERLRVTEGSGPTFLSTSGGKRLAVPAGSTFQKSRKFFIVKSMRE